MSQPPLCYLCKRPTVYEANVEVYYYICTYFTLMFDRVNGCIKPDGIKLVLELEEIRGKRKKDILKRLLVYLSAVEEASNKPKEKGQTLDTVTSKKVTEKPK